MKIIDTPSKPNGVIGIIYGPEGIGKTTLAAALDRPLFFDAEKGAHGMKVARLDEELTYTNMMKVMQELIGDSNGYNTFVIDTADAVETKFLADFCRDNKWNSIEDPGYGKGYSMFAELYCKFLEKCRALAESGMNVVIVAHADVKKFEMPDERGSYDRWQLKLSKQDAAKTKECADFIVFVNYRTNIVAADKKAGETKSHATGGRRWCYTSHTPAFDAKCRVFLDLPEECSLDEMMKKLPVAMRNAVVEPGERPRPAKTTDDAKDAEAKAKAALAAKRAKASAPTNERQADESVRPLVKKLHETAKAYNASEDKLFAKYNVKHTERYEAVTSIDDWTDAFIEWILAGFAKGKINL